MSITRRSVRLKPALPRLGLRGSPKNGGCSVDRPQSELSHRSRSKSPESFREQSSAPHEGIFAKATRACKSDDSLDSESVLEAGSTSATPPVSAPPSPPPRRARRQGPRGTTVPRELFSSSATAASSATAGSSATADSSATAVSFASEPSRFNSSATPESSTCPSPSRFGSSASAPGAADRSLASAATTPRTQTTAVSKTGSAALQRAAPSARHSPTKSAATTQKAASSPSVASTAATQSSPVPTKGQEPNRRDTASSLYHIQAELLELLDNEFSGTDIPVSDMLSNESKELYQFFLRGYARASHVRKRPTDARNDLLDLFEEVFGGEPISSCDADDRDPSDGADHYAFFARYAPPVEPTPCLEDNERRLHSMRMQFLGTRMAMKSLRQQAYQKALKSRQNGQRLTGAFDWAHGNPNDAGAGAVSFLPARSRINSVDLEKEPGSAPTSPAYRKSGTVGSFEKGSEKGDEPPCARRMTLAVGFGAAEEDEHAPEIRRGTMFVREVSGDSDDGVSRDFGRSGKPRGTEVPSKPLMQKLAVRALMVQQSGDAGRRQTTFEERHNMPRTTTFEDSSSRPGSRRPTMVIAFDDSLPRFSSRRPTIATSSSPPTDNDGQPNDSDMWADPVRVLSTPSVSPRKSALRTVGKSNFKQRGTIGFLLDDIDIVEGEDPFEDRSDSPLSYDGSSSPTPRSRSSQAILSPRRSVRRMSKLDERRKSRKSQALSSTSAAVTQAMKAEMRTREACESLRFLVFGCHAEEKRAKTTGGAFYDQACGNREEVLQLHRIWNQMDEDGSGDVEFHEFLSFFSKSKADRLLGMRCVKYLVGSGQCEHAEDAPQGCRIEDMMRLIWLKATKEDIATMMHWFHEAEHNKDRAPTPPILPKRKRREILENFPVFEQGGTISFQDLIDSGLVDDSTAKCLREQHDQESGNRINKDLLLLMLCPNGFRVSTNDLVAVDKDGRKIEYVSNKYFKGWMLAGKAELAENEH